jgi:hypothetical protein
MPKVLCSVATRGRYVTTLPMVLMAIANQTRPVDKLVVFDDNDDPKDLRGDPMYARMFQMLDAKGIPWEWRFAERKGQHHIHQKANKMGYEWVWRVDDDAVPEPNVLERLLKYAIKGVGAVGGAILTPPYSNPAEEPTGTIENIDSEPNIQWGDIQRPKRVEHLHCSFLYRAGVYDFNLGLSRVAHREETLFTYGLYQRGYSLLVIPNAVTWHLKSPTGGIRSETNAELYEQDERIFRNFMDHKDNTIVVLNCGMGDHIVFSHVLPKIKNPVVFGCYPEIIPCRPIAEAKALFGDIDPYSIYAKMDQWRWNGPLEKAFEKLYLP